VIEVRIRRPIMGKSSNTKMLMLMAVFIIGIYVLPTAVAKFAGSHTWEFNASTRVLGLQCGKCHQYIVNEINNTAANTFAGSAIAAHLRRSNDTDYMNTTGGPINFSRTAGDLNATLDNICWMCHVVEEGAGVTGTHTKVTIRVCTDIDCHGNQNDSTDTPGSGTNCAIIGEEKCNVTGRINNSADAHFNFYRPLSELTSPYGDENGGQYDYGFAACLACHTHVGLDLNLTRPRRLNLEMTLTNITAPTPWTLDEFSVNLTDVNSTADDPLTAGKDPGSVWVP
jgi:hypothetical protein